VIKTSRPTLTICGLTLPMTDDEIARCKRQKLSPAEYGGLMTRRAAIMDAMFYSGVSYPEQVRRDALYRLKSLDARLGFPFEHDRELARLDWRIAHPEAARLQDAIDEGKAALTFLDNFRSGRQPAARTSWYSPCRVQLLAKAGVLVKRGSQWAIDHASADHGVGHLQAWLQELERRRGALPEGIM
jgi:hypothetical protein